MFLLNPQKTCKQVRSEPIRSVAQNTKIEKAIFFFSSLLSPSSRRSELQKSYLYLRMGF